MKDMSSESLSISASLNKIGPEEELSLSLASVEEALRRPASAISNEEIHRDDRILDTYTVRSDEIRGGMGGVWKVRHEGWAVDLAMKRPQPRYFAEGSARRKEEFISECENWINLGLHPNIVSCYYVREIGGVPTIFSEWMEGGSLKDAIQNETLYEGTEEEVQRRVLDIAIQAARGLRYSHEKRLVHQDVKPGNLLLSGDWEAKVADFGLARAREKLEGVQEGGGVLPTGYTIAYCPKEQAEGAAAEEWMDTYAWSLTVLEMYAGRRFWHTGAEAFSVIFGKMNEQGGTSGPSWRVRPPEKLLEAFRKDSQSTSAQEFSGQSDTVRRGPGAWRDLADLEALLTEIWRETTGRAYFRESFNAASHTADSLNNMALSYLDLGKAGRAEQLWEQAASLEYGHPETLYNRALYLWMSGRTTDLHLLSEIDKVTEPRKRLELHRKAAAVRSEIPEGMAQDAYFPPENHEDWTESNSTEISSAGAFFEKGTACGWILGREGASEDKPSRLYKVSSDGKTLCPEGGLVPLNSPPTSSADGSVLVFYFVNRLSVYSVSDKRIILTKQFPKDSILSCYAGRDGSSCYLGRRDGLYEYVFATGEMSRILASESGIRSIRLRCGGRLLLLCDGQNRLMVMDPVRNVVTLTIPTVLPKEYWFDDFSGVSGTFDLSDRDTVLFYGVRNELFRHDLATGELLSRIEKGEPESRTWDLRSRYLITGRFNYCQIWDQEENICLRSFRIHAIQRTAFLEEGTENPERLCGYVLGGFPSRYRYFSIPASRPVPVWSLCRIRSTAEQTDQDEQYKEYIWESRSALEREDYQTALEMLSLARELPNRKNMPECWELYDALYPHFQRGELADCTVIHDFGPDGFPDYAPSIGPDGSWLYKYVWRGEDEILSASDGRSLHRFPSDRIGMLSCSNTRLISVVPGRDRKHWMLQVYALPEGETLLSKEYVSGADPRLHLLWTEEGREVVTVTVPGLFKGKVLFSIDPENGVLLEKGQARPHPVIIAAKNNELPAFYARESLENDMTAFIYDKSGEGPGIHKRLDIYSVSGSLLGRYDFKRTKDAGPEDIVRPVLLPQGYLAGEYGGQLVLFRTADFLNAGIPAGCPLPLPGPFGKTAMSADCRYLFSGGKLCRLEWKLEGADR